MSSNWEEDDHTKAVIGQRDFQKARSEQFESGFIKDLALKRRSGSRDFGSRSLDSLPKFNKSTQWGSDSLFEDEDDHQVPLEKQNPTSELKDEFFECFDDEVSCCSSAVGPLPSLTFANLVRVDQFKSKELKRKEQHTVLAELSMMTHVNGDAIDKERLCAFETAMTSAAEDFKRGEWLKMSLDQSTPMNGMAPQSRTSCSSDLAGR
mmetsp:Transcript_64240/g.184584  ORF Transcript_64240/g.184584 Transcript_64240/m.184584 type:complete len:207 (+) Transcript_64240:122-742(+)